VTRRGRDPHRLFLVVLAVGLGVRVVHLVLDRGNPFFEPALLDARYYDH
jgi:hypothetical protein